jgi:hypothetical protein
VTQNKAPEPPSRFGPVAARARVIRQAIGVYRELFLLFVISSPLLAFWFKQWPWALFAIWAFLFLNGVLLRSPLIIAAVVGGGLVTIGLRDETARSLRPLFRHGPPELVLLSFLLIAGAAGMARWLIFRPPSHASTNPEATGQGPPPASSDA